MEVRWRRQLRGVSSGSVVAVVSVWWQRWQLCSGGSLGEQGEEEGGDKVGP